MTSLMFKPAEIKQDGKVADFSVSSEALGKAISAVSPCLSKSDVNPVLKHVFMEANAGSLYLRATDSIKSARYHIANVHAKKEGTCVLPADKVRAICSETSGDLKFVVGVKGNKTTCKVTGQAQWTIPTVSADGFPNLDFMDNLDFHEVAAPQFRDALKAVRSSASQDTMRPYLMLIDIQTDKIRACDGTRFHQTAIEYPFATSLPVQIVPDLLGWLASVDTFEVGQASKAWVFRFGAFTTAIQKSSSNFPDVDALLLKPTLVNDLEFTVHRETLVKAIKQARVTADTITSGLVLTLNPGKLSLESREPKGGTCVTHLDTDWDAPLRHVVVNWRHLLDLIDGFSTDEVTFKLGPDLKSKPSAVLVESDHSVSVLSQIRLDWLD